MNEFFRTAIHTKNIPVVERVLRLVGASGAGVAAYTLANEPWLRWALAVTGVMLILTGLVGFCPACYFAGRKLHNRTAT